MELFTVNRYIDKDLGKSETNEDDILQKLMQKVEKRKRKLIGSKERVPTDKDDIQSEKKVKDIDLIEDEIDPINEGIPETKPLEEEDNDMIEVVDSGFKVLGEDADVRKRPKVEVVLPSWLAHPTVVSTNIAKSTDGTDSDANISQVTYLAPHIRGALKEMNITRLFPVQTAVVPWILESHSKPEPFRPRDICVSAPTGSGKTLAFAIPVVQLLTQRVERKIRALVVLPVAELALQVFRVFKKLCEKTVLTVCLLSNQTALHMEQEKLVEFYKDTYFSKVDIVITTPGRLVDHLHATKGFCLKSLQFLVIDEADRIMDAVFQNWLYHLDAHVRATSDQLLSGRAAPLCYNELELGCGSQPHKLLFSATLSQDPEKLQNLRLFQPKLFTSVLAGLNELREKYAAQAENDIKTIARGEFIGKYTTPAELTEKFCLTESRLKPLTLFSLVKEYQWTKFLCFTNSVESSGRLTFVLKQLFKSDFLIAELSASINVKQRSSILSSFSRGKIKGVVCSDALARGIDIPDVDIVISYDPPRHIKTYIHRIGRTARAGRAGTAITLLTQKEQQSFDKTLAEVGKSITEELMASTTIEEAHAQEYSLALNALREKITKDKRLKLLQKERVKEKSLLHKDISKMTLMEKLQVQASNQVHEKTEIKTTLSGKKNPSKKFKPKTQKEKKQNN